MHIVLTQIGNKKCPYLIQCIKQLLFFGNDKIILISNKFHENLLKNHKLLKKIIFVDENKVIKKKKKFIFIINKIY